MQMIMGGRGSGLWYRWDKNHTVESVRSIDLRYMRKHGLLNPDTAGSLQWGAGGDVKASIGFQCSQSYLQLNFDCLSGGGKRQPVIQRILFDRTPCHYGGERLWFLCPRCGRRVELLYGPSTLFLCRHCHQLPYASQQESYINNLITQKHKLGSRIFNAYEFGTGSGKKKGMHWSTFNRLNSRFESLEGLFERETNARLSGLTDCDD